MKTKMIGFVVLLLLESGLALAQEEATAPNDPAMNQAASTPQAVVPTGPAPIQMPPPPPAQPPPPPVQQVEQQPQQAAAASPSPLPEQVAAGQWVYTNQYGWIWMPYGTQYTYEGAGDNEAQPYSYAYYPAYGWTWLAAPWVWGWGAYPYFSVGGPWHFAWYRGLYHAGYGWGGYRGGYARAYANDRATVAHT